MGVSHGGWIALTSLESPRPDQNQVAPVTTAEAQEVRGCSTAAKAAARARAIPGSVGVERRRRGCC